MKLRLPNRLKAAVMAAAAAVVYATLGTATIGAAAQATEETGKTLHVYILTGQSNSLGAVKGDPASADTLAYYSTAKEGDGIQMWNGNMSGSVSDNAPSKNLVVSDEGKTWQTVAPQAPTLTNLCMGPEYGFAYMMQKKGWEMSAGHDVAIIKGSRDGGPNTQWNKGASLYDLLLNSVVEALKHVDQGSYDSVELNGLMYLQGESNTTAAGADKKFAAFVSNLQADVQTKLAELAAADSSYAYLPDMVKVGGTSETLYAVAGESASWGNQGNAVTNGTAAALAGLAESSDTTGFVYTRDLDKITPGDGMGVHYDGNSEITIGARYAYAMAAEQGMDVTEGGTVRVRSQEYGDTFSAADRTPTDTTARTPLSLNEAAAWWRSAAEAATWTVADLADKVAVWDVSSANMVNTAQGAETLSADLAVGGIRIEDPYAEDDSTGTHNATITIKNAEGANATLTVGNKGIEVQRGNLSLQTKVATNGAQTWTVAGGKTLTVANSISGADTVSLHKHADIASAAAAQFDFSAATDAGHRTWNIGDGVSVALSDTGFAQSTLAVEAAASAALTGGQVSLGSLTLGNGAALDLASGLTLSAGTVSFGDTAALTFNYGNGSFGALNAGSISASNNSSITINLGNATSLSRAEFTLGTGWSGWTVSDTAGSGKVLTLGSSAPEGYHISVDGSGNLILSGVPVYPDVQKTWVPAAASVTASNGLHAIDSAPFVTGSDSVKAVSVNGGGGNSMLLYSGYQTSLGEGKSLYTEMQVANAQFISNVGTFSQGDYNTTVTGDYNMKIADGTTIQSVFGASNIKVEGSVYTELSAANATYTGSKYGVVAAFGANVSGEVSLVINGGTFNSGVNIYGAMVNAGHCGTLGTLSIEVNDGSLQNIYVSDANAHTINAAQVILNGGTVNGSIYGSNTNVTITEGTSVYIGGEAIVKGDIYGGVANALSGKVTLHDMAENAKFLTNFGSGKSIYADNIVLNDTTIGSGFNGKLHANTVTIGEGSSLNAAKLAEGTITGNGTYQLASGSYALGADTSLSADKWQGTVAVSGVNQAADTTAHTAFDLEQLGNANSAVQIINSQFAMETGTHSYAGRVILGGDTATTDGDWRIVYGQPSSGTLAYNLSGEVSGKGGITNSWAHSGVTVAYNFTGDISEWTGSFRQTASSSSSLTFGGNAHVVNAEITRASNNGTLSITAATDVTFNNTVNVQRVNAANQSITLSTNGEGAAATHGALKVTGEANIGSLNLGGGTSATFNGATTISGALTNSGLLTVNDTLNLTGGRGTAWDLGSVAGTGNIVASSANGNREYTISGDLTNWTGAFKQAAGSGNMTLNITGTSVLNADIINQATAAACTLDVKLLHDMTVNGTMSAEGAGPVNVTVGDATHVVSVTFNQTLYANTLTAGNGSTFTFGKDAAFVGGTVNAYNNSTLTVAGAMGSAENALTKLAVGSGGSLTVNEGADIYASQLIMSDNNGVGNTTINGGTIHITGTENGHTTDASLLLAHWGHNSTLTLNGGELEAEDTVARLSWTGTGTLSVQGGTAKLLGIANWAQYGEKGKVLLGAADSGNGVIELGCEGISDATNAAEVQIQFGRGTLKATADTVIGWNATNKGTASTNGTTISLIAAGDGATTLDSNGHTLGIGNKLEGSGNVAKVGEGSLALTGHLKTTGAVTIEEGSIDLKTAGASSGHLTFTNAADISLAKKDGAEKATLSNVLLEAEDSKGISAAASGSKATVANTAVSVGNNAKVAISDVALTDSDITVASGATATLSHATVAATTGATLSGVTVGEDVSVQAGAGASLSFLNQTSPVGLNNLVIGNGATVSAYVGTPTAEQIAAAQSGAANIEASIAVSGVLTAGSGATLNANLTLNNGATLAVSTEGGLQMGSSVTLANGALLNLSEDILVTLNGMIRGEEFTLFTGVDAFSIDGGAYDHGATYMASNYFNLVGVDYAEHFVVRYEIPAGSVNGGTVSLYMATPEPATTTLSLLALAGLMARRRRR